MTVLRRACRKSRREIIRIANKTIRHNVAAKQQKGSNQTICIDNDRLFEIIRKNRLEEQRITGKLRADGATVLARRYRKRKS